MEMFAPPLPHGREEEGEEVEGEEDVKDKRIQYIMYNGRGHGHYFRALG